MHKVKVTKYYNGGLEVRTEDMKKGIRLGGLQIIHDNKVALEVSVDSLKDVLSRGGQFCKSKFGKKYDYELFFFRYYKKNEDNRQSSLL